jgi:septal ring factor EnvC (AmiA/AmiB activator)
MRARYTVSGKVRIELPDGVLPEFKGDHGRLVVIVGRDDFEELAKAIRDGDEEKAMLRTELRDLHTQFEQTVRDFQRTGQERDALEEERDALRRLRQVEPARMVIHTTAADESRKWAPSHDHLAAVERDDIDELKAVIVSQAREIARLKGESE